MGNQIAIAAAKHQKHAQYAQQSREHRPTASFPSASHFWGIEYGCEPGYGMEAHDEKPLVPPFRLL